MDGELLSATFVELTDTLVVGIKKKNKKKY